MRILHVITRFLAAGSERNLTRWMEWERAAGHEVHLAVGRDSDPSAVPEGIEVHELSALVRSIHPLRDLQARRQVRQLLGHREFDICHTHQSKAGVVGREAARGQVPVILHTIHMSPFGPGYSPVASAAFSAAERFCARFTDRIISVGEELKDSYLHASIGSPDQFRVIRSPIDIERFATAREVSAAERAQLRQSFGARPGTPVAVSIGALEPRKRHELLIREMAPLISGGQLDLLIAGDGPRREELMQLGEQLGCAAGLKLLGHTRDVPGLLAAADVLMHASTAEGVPQVVIQSLAAGTPVVATDVTGLREVPGAPVSIVPRDGRGLTEAVRVAMRLEAPAVSLDALEAWRPEMVAQQIERMFREIEPLCAPQGVAGRSSARW